MRGMAREYAAGNSLGPGWHESAGIFGCPVGGSVADGAVRPGRGMACSRAEARLNFSTPKAGDPEDAGSTGVPLGCAVHQGGTAAAGSGGGHDPQLDRRAVELGQVVRRGGTASQAPLAAKRPDWGDGSAPTPYWRSRMASRSRRGGDVSLRRPGNSPSRSVMKP